MRSRSWLVLAGVLCVGTLLTCAAAAQDPSGEPPPPPPQAQPDAPPPPAQPQPEGVEVMARGPVHEAYAEPTEARPEPSPLVTKQPPDPVPETPPEQKPEGDNVQWIPGYWAWDQDQNDFLWVSGFWRTPPPGRRWVPGVWQQVEGGWHWVPGFWAPDDQEQLQYLPAPPPSVDEGPRAPAPDASSTYVPGCWVYRETRYFWRPGFWCAFHPGWLWVPAHYVWTPGGYLFVEGYWDHPLEMRGLLFAPVRLAAGLLRRERWSYTPQYVVQPDFLMSALFVRPASCHYYFGDYFEQRYTRAGFVPWIDYRVGRSGLDPNFAYYRHQFARYGTWERGLRDLYTARFRGDVPRPPITLVQQTKLIRNITENRTASTVVNRNINITHVQNVSVLAPLAQVNNTRVTNLVALANAGGPGARPPAITPHVIKLQAMPAAQRAEQQRAAAQVHAVAQQRRQAEARLLSQGPPVRASDAPKQVKLALPAVHRPEPRPGDRPTPPVTSRPGERPVTPRPGERPMPPVTPRPGERPATPVTPRPGETPRPPDHVRQPPAPAPRVAPPPPTVPRHEDRPIPKHEPPRPPTPPRNPAPPRPAAPPPHQAAPAPHPAPPAPARPSAPPQPPRQTTPAPHPAPPPPPHKTEPPHKEQPKKG